MRARHIDGGSPLGEVRPGAGIVGKGWLLDGKGLDHTILCIAGLRLLRKIGQRQVVDLQIVISINVILILYIFVIILRDIHRSRYLLEGSIEEVVKSPATEATRNEKNNGEYREKNPEPLARLLDERRLHARKWRRLSYLRAQPWHTGGRSVRLGSIAATRKRRGIIDERCLRQRRPVRENLHVLIKRRRRWIDQAIPDILLRMRSLLWLTWGLRRL